MTKTPAPPPAPATTERPRRGGSYVRTADGALKTVERPTREPAIRADRRPVKKD